MWRLARFASRRRTPPPAYPPFLSGLGWAPLSLFTLSLPRPPSSSLSLPRTDERDDGIRTRAPHLGEKCKTCPRSEH